jgi:hypothetical protein
MKGGSFTGGFEGKVSYQGMCKRRLLKRVCLSIGTPLGNLGRLGLFTGNFEREMKDGSGNGTSLSVVAVRGTWRGSPLLGIQKDMWRRA